MDGRAGLHVALLNTYLAGGLAMMGLVINKIYEIELCSGEIRHWQYLGTDSRRLVWWMDVETKTEFHEGALMYSWSIVGPKP